MKKHEETNMSETVETTVRCGISGQFIDNPETFAEISHLFDELSLASNRLQDVEIQLLKCNHPAWLNSFARRCHRLNRNREKELLALVNRLEAKKTSLKVKIDGIRARLLQLE